eukprot:gene27471-36249_t
MKYSRPVRITSEAVEKNIRFQRELDVRQQQLEAFGKENANLISAANAQSRIDVQRRLMQQSICKNEQSQEEALRKVEYEKKFRELTIQQNQALASELDKDAADAERRSREIQKICEESPELRELEAMLRVAYLNKERAAQHEEKILLATREQERIQAIEDQMEQERLRAIRAESDKDKIKKAMYENQREVLQKQINDRRKQLSDAQLQIEKERKMVDEIIQRIHNEDEVDFRRRKEKQLATAQMVKAFEEQRRAELEAARESARAEDERIAAYNRAMEARSEGAAAKKQAKKDEEDRILAQIVAETEQRRREEEEFNSLRDLLWEEELEAKRTADTEARKQKQTALRRDMMAANEQIMRQKDEQRRLEAEKEARLVAAMRNKFAADEQKEREEEAARKSVKVHHMTLVEKQRQERKNMYEQERSQEMASLDEAARREEYRKKVITEARKRLLEEHAARLEGFMPAKAFDNIDEYRSFQSDRDRK